MGVQAHAQKFWFGENLGKIIENPGKICGNLGKICENILKIRENLGKLPENTGKKGANHILIWKKMVPNVLWFEKNGAQNHTKTVFLEVIRTVFMKRNSHKKWPKIFSGKFGKIRAKILRTPKNLPASTPMNGSVMNVVCYELVCYERGLLWTGLLWTWSVSNGLLWVVCYGQVCFEREPIFFYCKSTNTCGMDLIFRNLFCC